MLGYMMRSATRHGTEYMYREYRCRCESCVEAMRQSRRQYRQNNPEAVREARKRYYSKPDVSQAYVEYRKEYRKNNPGITSKQQQRKCQVYKERNDFTATCATRQGAVWTAQEDELLVSSSVTVALALKMGRTLKGLEKRKTVLNKKAK